MDWTLWIITGLIGLMLGSFLNVVIFRGPALWGFIDEPVARGSLAHPRSYCPHCRAPIKRIHLLPLAGYLITRGQCAACAQPISARYPLVEILGCLIALAAIARFGFGTEALLAAAFGWTMIALAFIDGETGYLPDILTLPLLGMGIACNTVDLFVPFPQSVLGAALGYGVFVMIEISYRQIRGRDGLGRGDAKILGAIGAWSGWPALPAAVFLGAVATLLWALMIKVRQGQHVTADYAVPFGPGLAAAGIVVVFTPFAMI